MESKHIFSTLIPALGLLFAPGASEAQVQPRAPTGGDCRDCFECFLPDMSLGHRLSSYQAEGGGYKLNIHTDCQLGGCVSSGHQFCVGLTQEEQDERALLEAKIELAINGQFSAVLELLSDYPEKVHLNTKRRAVQIEAACNSSLVAQISLSERQFAAIVATSETGPIIAAR